TFALDRHTRKQTRQLTSILRRSPIRPTTDQTQARPDGGEGFRPQISQFISAARVGLPVRRQRLTYICRKSDWWRHHPMTDIGDQGLPPLSQWREQQG